MEDAVPLRTAGDLRLSGRALGFLTDEKLATQVAAGNDDAFVALYNRHHQAVYRYCLSLTRQEADARDALQSTMLAALAALRDRPIEGRFKPWLLRIAHNESISIIRGRKREAPQDAAPAAAVSDDPEAREQFRTLVEDIAALPARQRGALVMRELSDLSYAEIAAALGTSEAAGKQLVYEARSALADLRAGHDMACDAVRERISAHDLRLLRGRKVRAHLRSCEPCRDFEEGIRRRRSALALLAPPLSPVLAAGVLENLFGGGGSGGLGAGGAAGATGATSGGASAAAPLALKLAAAALVTGAAGVGVYEAATAINSEPVPSSAAAVTQTESPAGRAALGDERAARRERGPGPGRGRAGAGPAVAGAASAAGAKADAGKGSQAPDSPGAGQGEGGSPSSGTEGPGPGAGVPGGGSGGGSGGGGDPTPPGPPPPPGGGGSGVLPGTPPGHGGTPPGHGGTPPGQGMGDTPPGHLGNPGKGGG